MRRLLFAKALSLNAGIIDAFLLPFFLGEVKINENLF